jgi:hypothetical protein
MSKKQELARIRKNLAELYHQLSAILVTDNPEYSTNEIERAFNKVDEAIGAINRELRLL